MQLFSIIAIICFSNSVLAVDRPAMYTARTSNAPTTGPAPERPQRPRQPVSGRSGSELADRFADAGMFEDRQ